MNRRIDPATTLGEENAKGIRNDGLADSLRAEYVLALREGLEHERGEISIFTEEE